MEQSKQLNKNIKIYNINIALLTVARTLPHAILTVLLLDKGISIAGIAFIQAMYSLAMVLCEFPSGIMSDLYSRKMVYMISLISLALSYFFIIFSDNFALLCLSWFIYGISSAMDTGTLDAHIINEIKSGKDMNYLQKFLKNINQLSLMASIVGATIGSILYFIIGVNIYWISILFIVLVMLITSKQFLITKETQHTETPKISEHIKGSFYELKKTPELTLYIFLFGIGQFFFQPHFQLWQALFLFKEVDEKWFFILYIIFQLVTIISYNMDIKKLNSKKVFFVSIVGIFFLLMTKFITNIYLFILFYLLTCYVAFVMNYFINFSFNKIIPKEKISSITSLSSTITRIFSFIILIFSSYMLKELSMTNYFLISFGLMFISSMVLLILLSRKETVKESILKEA